jgi:hypothetical protein
MRKKGIFQRAPAASVAGRIPREMADGNNFGPGVKCRGPDCKVEELHNGTNESSHCGKNEVSGASRDILNTRPADAVVERWEGSLD